MKASLKSILLFSLTLSTLFLFSEISHAQIPRRQVVEAKLMLVFGEGLGRVPLIAPGIEHEFGAGHFVGLSVGGFGAIAAPKTMNFLEQTRGGGGANAAIRIYLRGRWPRGFAIGAASSIFVVHGVGLASPRGELIYRFLFSHFSLRLSASVGGLILWDTSPEDNRPGPAVVIADYPDTPLGEPIIESETLAGIWISAGISIGWSGVL